jgi:hypothetical protein
MPDKITINLHVKVEVNLDDWQLIYGQERGEAAEDAVGHVPNLVREELTARLGHIRNGARLVEVTTGEVLLHPDAPPSTEAEQAAALATTAGPRAYPFIAAWGRLMGSNTMYIAQEVDRAKAAKAPATATYQRPDGAWSTFTDLQRHSTRQQVLAIARSIVEG